MFVILKNVFILLIQNLFWIKCCFCLFKFIWCSQPLSKIIFALTASYSLVEVNVVSYLNRPIIGGSCFGFGAHKNIYVTHFDAKYLILFMQSMFWFIHIMTCWMHYSYWRIFSSIPTDKCIMKVIRPVIYKKEKLKT